MARRAAAKPIEVDPEVEVYVVTGAVAVVKLAGKGERYVYRGGRFTAAAADQAHLAHLLSAGLIAPAPKAAEAEPSGEGGSDGSGSGTD